MGDDMAEQPQGASATMADVARLAGVSVPTVSRVLSGTHPVSHERRQRVEEAIATLGFRRSAAARALKNRRSDIVAVITSSTSMYGYAETIRGIELAARLEQLTVMIAVAETDAPEDVTRAMDAALAHTPTGVLVLAFDTAGVAVLDRFPTDVPVVAVSGQRDRRFPQALIDERSAAFELTSHLLQLGHPTVTHVSVPASGKEDGRTTGWREALHRAGAQVPDVIEASWLPASGRDIGRALAHDRSVTAVFCGNDEIAMGFMRGLAEEGVRVPDDISVVGFDDHPLAALWTPSLTTVRQDFAELGFRALQMLPALREHPHISARELCPRVVLRESSAPVRSGRRSGRV
ncbi:LacI family DNA-binding transcriptional regulator [Streptomyces rubrogriseus]|uniref:LacI family DNA-binding transcriptional regulator n=1 Tax=Streptomyces rubrogriseus TaxID=194673 RepID=UPI0036F4F4D2